METSPLPTPAKQKSPTTVGSDDYEDVLETDNRDDNTNSMTQSQPPIPNPSVPLTAEQRAFVPIGAINFNKTRTMWTRQLFDQNSDAQRLLSSALRSGPSDDSFNFNLYSQAPSSAVTTHASDLDMSFTTADGSRAARRHDDDRDDDDDDEELSDDNDSLDVSAVMRCLRSYEPFPGRIKLRSIVDILQVIWEDEQSG